MSPALYQKYREEWAVSNSNSNSSASNNDVANGNADDTLGKNVVGPCCCYVVDGKPYLPGLRVVQGKSDNDEDVNDSLRFAVLACLTFAADNNDNDNDSNKDKPVVLNLNAAASKNWTVQRISGGMTNVLYKVSVDDSYKVENDAVLVRVFGAAGMIDRDVETCTFAALAAAKIAPAYHGRFQNGRIEGWKDGMHTCTVPDLQRPAVSTAIARAMADLHGRFVVPPALQDYHAVEKPSLWTQLESWYEQALSETTQNALQQTDSQTHCQHSLWQRYQQLNLPAVRQELDWIQTDIIPVKQRQQQQSVQNSKHENPALTKVTFCHNDVLAANVMYKQPQHEHENEELQIQLIDFEYGGVNYVAADIANHFNEMAGGPPVTPTPDYTLLPDKDLQRAFCRAYLQRLHFISKEKDGQNEVVVESDDMEISEEELHDMLKAIEAHLMVNHFYWGLWAVNQAAAEGVEQYEFMTYATRRLEQYWKCKAVWLQEEEAEENEVAAQQ